MIIFIHYLVAGLIFWRLPRSWFGLLTAFVILVDRLFGDGGCRQAVRLVDGMGKIVRPPDLPRRRWFGRFIPSGCTCSRTAAPFPLARWPDPLSGVFMVFMMAGILDTVGILPPAVWQFVVAPERTVHFCAGAGLLG